MVFPSNDDMIKQIMLTSSIIWKRELNKKDVESWLSNFKGEVFSIEKERKLALWLLLNFVYYNTDEVKHLCNTLYNDFIHAILEKEHFKNGKEVKKYYDKVLSSTRFFDLGRKSESSGFVLYFFRQENQLPIENFISDPKNLNGDVKNIVYVDDVTLSKGTNNQARKYLDKDRERYEFDDKNIFLITFIATKQSKEILEKVGYKVISCITLGKENKCFSSESIVFHQFPEHKDDCMELASHYGKQIYSAHPLGWKDGQYMFGFFYNTPNNTLPIFWCENNGWKPILKRYQKKYTTQEYAKLERFV